MEEEEGGADGFKVLWETSEIFLYNVGVMDWILFSPQNSYVEALTSPYLTPALVPENVTLCGNRVMWYNWLRWSHAGVGF